MGDAYLFATFRQIRSTIFLKQDAHMKKASSGAAKAGRPFACPPRLRGKYFLDCVAPGEARCRAHAFPRDTPRSMRPVSSMVQGHHDSHHAWAGASCFAASMMRAASFASRMMRCSIVRIIVRITHDAKHHRLAC